VFAQHLCQCRFPRADITGYCYVFWFLCLCHKNESTKYDVPSAKWAD
jgi:hypothetical protein